MDFLIIENGIITNIIVSEKDYAEKMGFLPYYEGAIIGEKYDPPSIEKSIKRIEEENAQLQTQLTDLQLVICELYEMQLNSTSIEEEVLLDESDI